MLICNLSRSKPDDFLGDYSLHISVDLTDPIALEAAADELKDRIQNTREGEVILFNNSGFGDYGCSHHLSPEKQLRMIDLNIRAVVDLSHRLLPLLLQRGGAIVNIASIAGFQPTPFLATYGATKAFVLNWSLALNEDLVGTGVHVLAVCPGPTRSNFFKAAGFETPPVSQNGPNLDMTSEAVAERTLDALAKQKTLVVTGAKNQLIALFGRMTPITWVTRIGGRILRKMRLEQHKAGGAE